MIAEVLLQNVDKEVLQNLQDKGLSLKKTLGFFDMLMIFIFLQIRQLILIIL